MNHTRTKAYQGPAPSTNTIAKDTNQRRKPAISLLSSKSHKPHIHTSTRQPLSSSLNPLNSIRIVQHLSNISVYIINNDTSHKPLYPPH